MEGGTSRPSEPLFLLLGDTPAVARRHVASMPPSRPQLGVTRGSAPPGYPTVLVRPRIAGS